MQIAVIAVGRCRKPYIQAGVRDYADRIGRYASLDQVEVPEARGGGGRSPEEAARREGERVRRASPAGAFTVALDVNGRAAGSVDLAHRLADLGLVGKSRVAFWIGGAFGLPEDVLMQADLRLSLSAMTFPHELARLMLLEQIYRAFTIIRGERYHK